MAGCPHPQASHPWLPAQALSCRPHPFHLLRPPPPHPDTRLSFVGPSQRVDAAAMGLSANLPMAWVSCARPVATPSTRRNSATSSTSRAAAPMARVAISFTTPARTWLPLATPMSCARALASQACPQAAEPRHHPQSWQALPCPRAPSRPPAPHHHHLGTFHFHPLPSLLPLGLLWPEETLPQPVVPPAEGPHPAASGDPWVAWLGVPLHTPWDLTPMNMPVVAAVWEVPTHQSLRLGFLGHPSHLQPLGGSPSSIASLCLSDKCLPSTDQLDLKGGHFSCTVGNSYNQVAPRLLKCINPLH